MRLTQIILVTLVAGTLTLAGCAAKRNRRVPPAAAVTGSEPARAQAAGKKAAKEAAGGARLAAKAAAVVAVPKAPAGTGMQWSIEGWGLNEFEAEHDAVKRASKVLADFLRSQQPPLAMVPSEEYVRQRLIHEGPQRRKELDEEVGGVKVQCWSVTLAVGPQDYRQLVQIDRDARHKQLRGARMEWFAKGLVAAVAGLVALLVFIRVGQWASGLWTRRVRVVVACLLVAAVAGFLCLS